MKIYYMKNLDKAILGYVSPSDFFSTLLGLKNVVINFWLSFICLSTSLITNYIWDTASSIYTLVILMILDWTMGVFLALRAKFQYDKFKDGKIILNDSEIDYYKRRYFRSTRFPRMVVSIIMSLAILSLSWWLAKANAIYYFAPSLAYGGITGTYFVSLIENCAEYGILPKDIVNILKEKLNPINWVKK